MLISHKYLAKKEKRGMLLLRRGDAGRIDAEADQGHKTFFFFRQILNTTGQMPRVASRPARQSRRRAALTQTKASAKKPGAPEPDEPEKPAR